MKRLLLLLLLSTSFFGFSETADRFEGRVFWRGTVDDRIHLVVTGSTLETRTVSGTTQSDGTYSFTSPLPRQAVMVNVNKKKGRGTLSVIQQPSLENDFTAIVEVYDKGGGAKEYQLEIFW